MGIFFYSFCSFCYIGSSNAVNLTDLDGLATVPVMLVALSFSLICYVVGNTVFFLEYLQIQYVPNVGELSMILRFNSRIMFHFFGTTRRQLKFLWKIFGSLSLGGSIASVAIIAKHEIVLAIVGGFLF